MVETILVTGAAGFIGFHVTRRLLETDCVVVGIDNLNAYYDLQLKHLRLKQLVDHKNFRFIEIDLADNNRMARLFSEYRFRYVVNLAAQAGVRHSLTAPHDYISANMLGFLNVLEGCRNSGCRHLVYASSSSVYGANTALPFRTRDSVDHPVSLYGASKKANELMSHAYAHLFAVPSTGLRFFTVYGPWGRPDMAMWLFAAAILEGRPIKLFNHGRMRRDFTFIDDIVEALVRLLRRPPAGNPLWSGDHPDPATSLAPWRLFNLGNHTPVDVLRVVELIEEAIGKPAIREYVDMQPGDVPATFADVDDLIRDVGFAPATPIEVGVARFVEWYLAYRRGQLEAPA